MLIDKLSHRNNCQHTNGSCTVAICGAHNICGAAFLCLGYLPPEQSTWYSQAKTSIEETFEELLEEIAEASSVGEVILAGDFNARTGSLPDWLDSAEIEALAEVPGFASVSKPVFATSRASQDGMVNKAGRLLLELCQTAECRILNGRAEGDREGSLPAFLQREGAVS